jgi:hypothetical protein
VVDDDDTQVGPMPKPSDTDALPSADTGEWDDTDREIVAHDDREFAPAMFDDTGVVIIDKPVEPAPPSPTDTLVVTFRKPCRTRRPPPRGSTVADWPPAPREPAARAPQIRERALKNAGVYTVVARPETKS